MTARIKKKPAKAAKRPAPSTKPVWQKLLLKQGAVMMVNPPRGYTKWLAGGKGLVALAPDLVRLQADDEKGVENAWLFVNSIDEVKDHMFDVGDLVRPSTNLIVSYKKGNAELHRDTLRDAMAPLGFNPVSLIAVDDVWSAMRFRRTG